MSRGATLALFAVGLVSVTSLACGSKELSRAKALALLEGLDQFSKEQQVLAVTPDAFDEGVTRGFWGATSYFGASGGVAPEVGDYIVKATGTSLMNMHDASLTVRKPFRLLAEITGIAAAPMVPGLMEVQFRWKYDGLEPLAALFAQAGGTGVAYARRYDDGWRLEKEPEPELALSTERLVLDAATATLADDIASRIMARRREARPQPEGGQGRSEMLQRAKAPTRAPDLFSCLDISDAKPKKDGIALTDVSVAYDSNVIWFGDIEIESLWSSVCTDDRKWGQVDKQCVLFTYRKGGDRKVQKFVFDSEAEQSAFHGALSRELAAWRTSFPGLAR